VSALLDSRPDGSVRRSKRCGPVVKHVRTADCVRVQTLLTPLEPAVLSSRSGLPPELKRTCQFALDVTMWCVQRRKNLERITNAAHDAELRRMGTAGIQSIDGRVVDRIRNNPVGICVRVRIPVFPHDPRKPICVATTCPGLRAELDVSNEGRGFDATQPSRSIRPRLPGSARRLRGSASVRATT
jgi:hypothetical protein